MEIQNRIVTARGCREVIVKESKFLYKVMETF